MKGTFPGQQKKSLTEKAYQVIKKAIFDGEFRPGAILHEFQIKRRFKIGRTPLREACSRLCFDQLLEVVPRHGYYSTPSKPTESFKRQLTGSDPLASARL